MTDNKSSILNWFLPQHDARKITLRMLMLVVVAYLGRVLINQLLESERGPFGPLWWFICPIACVLGIALVGSLMALAFFAVRRADHFAPALVVIGGIILVPLLPLPPLPRPVFPEEEFFSAHHTEFEQVVNLARQDKLECPIVIGCYSLRRDLPHEFGYLSIDGYVLVAHNSPSDMTVTFQPIDFYYPVVYFDEPDDRKLPGYSACRGAGDGAVRKLDEHWYLCLEDWN